MSILTLFTAVSAPAAVTFDFDYTYDTGGFFTVERRSLMSLVGALFEARIADTLSAITPGSGNTWQVSYYNPADGTLAQLTDLSIGSGVLKVYVGARSMAGGTLGVGGFGGVTSGAGDAGFVSAVTSRGQAGFSTQNDVAIWGGSIAFNSSASWHFDSDPSTIETIGNDYDFYSVAVHELGHVLGLGTAQSWTHRVNGSHQFTGSAAVAVYGGNVPLNNHDDHFAEGTMSVVAGTATAQESLLDPSIAAGTRKYMTDLDWAALQDLGWQVSAIPEPAPVGMLILGGMLLLRLSAKGSSTACRKR